MSQRSNYTGTPSVRCIPLLLRVLRLNWYFRYSKPLKHNSRKNIETKRNLWHHQTRQMDVPILKRNSSALKMPQGKYCCYFAVLILWYNKYTTTHILKDAQKWEWCYNKWTAWGWIKVACRVTLLTFSSVCDCNYSKSNEGRKMGKVGSNDNAKVHNLCQN